MAIKAVFALQRENNKQSTLIKNLYRNKAHRPFFPQKKVKCRYIVSKFRIDSKMKEKEG